MFYLEVQKYKDLTHTHADDEIVKKKCQAIVDCYFESAIAPPCQVTCPKLLEWNTTHRGGGVLRCYPPTGGNIFIKLSINGIEVLKRLNFWGLKALFHENQVWKVVELSYELNKPLYIIAFVLADIIIFW